MTYVGAGKKGFNIVRECLNYYKTYIYIERERERVLHRVELRSRLTYVAKCA